MSDLPTGSPSSDPRASTGAGDEPARPLARPFFPGRRADSPPPPPAAPAVPELERDEAGTPTAGRPPEPASPSDAQGDTGDDAGSGGGLFPWETAGAGPSGPSDQDEPEPKPADEVVLEDPVAEDTGAGGREPLEAGIALEPEETGAEEDAEGPEVPWWLAGPVPGPEPPAEPVATSPDADAAPPDAVPPAPEAASGPEEIPERVEMGREPDTSAAGDASVPAAARGDAEVASDQPESGREFPPDAFFVPEEADHTPLGMPAAGEDALLTVSRAETDALAGRLEAIAERLRAEGGAALRADLATPGHLEALLAALLAGYLAGRGTSGA